MKFLIAFAVIAVAFAEEVRVAHLPPAPVHLPPAPAPAVETHYPFIAPASVLEALYVPMPNVLRAGDETPVEEALTVMVSEIPSEDQDDGLKVHFFDGPVDVDAAFGQVEPVKVAEIQDTQDDGLKVRVFDGPFDVDAAFVVEPVKIAEIPMVKVAENIESPAEPEVNMVPIEPVKVAAIETEVPIDRVKVMDPFSMLPRYDTELEVNMGAPIEPVKVAPIEPVKVAAIETEVPVDRVKVMDPFSMLPRYDHPYLR